MADSDQARVTGLFIYPVKSCRGIAVDSVTVTDRGWQHDREWMVVDPTNRFVSQRELPRMALVGTALEAEGLRLSTVGHPDCFIPFDRRGTACTATVWGSECAARDQGDEVAVWLSAVLGAPLRLVRFDAGFQRMCKAPRAAEVAAHTMFADGYPVLVISEASLAELNERLAARGHSALPMNRFRPNLVVSGLQAFDEDHLDTLEVGPVTLRMVKACVRCQVTTTDQTTAEVGQEPLPTLSSFRMNPDLGGVTFGQNAVIIDGVGSTIRRTDAAIPNYAF